MKKFNKSVEFVVPIKFKVDFTIYPDTITWGRPKKLNLLTCGIDSELYKKVMEMIEVLKEEYKVE